MRKLLLLLTILTSVIFFTLYAKKKETVIIKIDGFSKKKISIAITNFKNLTPKEAEAEKSNQLENITNIIKNNLNLTGWFQIIDPRAFIVDPDKNGFQTTDIQFKKWAAIDAMYLVKGTYKLIDNQINVSAFLYDVISRKTLIAKNYAGLLETYRKIAHQFSNKVVEMVTGEPGIFTTKIAAVTKIGTAKEIVYMDFDGENIVNVTNSKKINLSPKWSKDGTKIAFISKRGPFWKAFIADLTVKSVSQLTKFKRNVFSISFSPIEDILVASMEIEGDSELILLDMNGNITKQLTKRFHLDISPEWSPDGKTIVYVSARTGKPQIYKMNINGEDDQRILFDGKNNETPSWSPRGDQIVFAGLDTDGQFDIFKMSVSGSDIERLTYDSRNNEYPCWSPDGRFIAFSSDRNDGKYHIYIMNSDGSNVRKLTKGDNQYYSPSWSPVLK